MLAQPEEFKVSINEQRLQEATLELDKIKFQIESELRRVQAVVAVFGGQADIYRADQAAETSRLNSQIEQFRIQLEEGVARANAHLKTGDQNLQQLTNQLQIALQSLIAAAETSTGVGTGALSAVSLAASSSVSHSSSTSVSG